MGKRKSSGSGSAGKRTGKVTGEVTGAGGAGANSGNSGGRGGQKSVTRKNSGNTENANQPDLGGKSAKKSVSRKNTENAGGNSGGNAGSKSEKIVKKGDKTGKSSKKAIKTGGKGEKRAEKGGGGEKRAESSQSSEAKEAKARKSRSRKKKLISQYRYKGKWVNEEMQIVAIRLCERLVTAGIRCSYQYIIDKLYELVMFFIRNQRYPDNMSEKDRIIARLLNVDADYFNPVNVGIRVSNKRNLGKLSTIYINKAFTANIHQLPYAEAMAVIDYQLYHFINARRRYLGERSQDSMGVSIYMMYESVTRIMFIDFNDFIVDGADRSQFIDLLEDEVLSEDV